MPTDNEHEPKIPNDCERPPLIFDALQLPHYDRVRQFRKYFKQGPMVPLSYYNDAVTGQMVERGADVMRVLWDAYYEQLKPDRS